MKVFISWSKDLSKQVALELEKWLSDIFDHVEPWVSDSAIESGERTYSTIADAIT